MKIQLSTIEIRRRRVGQLAQFYETISNELKEGKPTFIPCDEAFAEIVKHQLQFRQIQCQVEPTYSTNLSRLDLTNERAVTEGYELHTDDKWGTYARKFSGLTLTPITAN